MKIEVKIVSQAGMGEGMEKVPPGVVSEAVVPWTKVAGMKPNW